MENKIICVTFTGGIIGLFSQAPQRKLQKIVAFENANGFRVVQVIPAESGNIFLFFYRLFLLLITLLFYTEVNGYYVILEKFDPVSLPKVNTNAVVENAPANSPASPLVQKFICKNCSASYSDTRTFCSQCGSKM